MGYRGLGLRDHVAVRISKCLINLYTIQELHYDYFYAKYRYLNIEHWDLLGRGYVETPKA